MDYIRLLRTNPDFTKLWAAQVVSLLGDWFNTIVISALIVSFTEGTSYQGLAISGYLLARLIPPLLMRPWAGVLADRFDRKRILIISDVLRSLAVVGLLFATQGPEYLPLIYVFTVIQFLIASVFEPARNALMPSVLYRDQLVRGNTLSSITWSAMLAIGAIVGGLVAQFLGIQIALVIDSLTFLVSAGIVITLVVPETPRSDIGQEARIVQDVSERTFIDGIRYLLKNPATAAAIFVKTGMSIGSVDAVLIIYGTQLFAIGEQGTSSMAILWTAFGIGSIIGPLFMNRFSDGSVRTLRHLVTVGFVMVIFGWLFWGFAPSLEFAVLAIILRAMGSSVNWTYSSIIIQKIVPDEYLGRMFSMDFACFELVQGISAITVGLLIDAIGSQNVNVIVFGTAFLTVPTLLIWIWAVRRLDHAEAQHMIPSVQHS